VSTDAGSANPAASPSRARLLAGVLPAVLLAAVAVWEVIATVRAGHDVPGDDAWDRAAAAVRADHRSGDLIVFAPDWVDPVGRLHLGDLIPVDMAGRMDADRYGRIWELSIRGARARDTAGLEPVWSQRFGGVTVRRFERTPVEVITDLVATLPAVTKGARVELEEVDFAPRRCVAVSPGPGRTAELRWPTAELGGQLVGYVGLADVFTRRENLFPARLEVAVAGGAATTVEVGADEGWKRFAVATTPGRAEVTIRATDLTPTSWKPPPGTRQHIICFAAEARR